tara:strand:+ start:4805 stop:5581 length:777 start_codon:yes stop_codon:yes gene_type:complete
MFVKDIVVGSSVESALYALLTESLFINTRLDPPMFYRHMEFPILGTSTEPEAWSKLCLMLSFLGKKIDAHDRKVSIQENNIKIRAGLLLENISFDSCFVFDTTFLDLENEIHTARASQFLVLDDFELSYLGGPEHIENIVNLHDNFIRKLFFYSSDRISGFHGISDCVAESLLSSEQLHSFDFSDTTARFAVERYLKLAGVKGKFMNLYKNGSSKYRRPKVKHVNRLVFERDKNIYRDSKNVKFLSLKLGEIINELSS